MDNNFSIGNLLLNNIVLILHKVRAGISHLDDNDYDLEYIWNEDFIRNPI